MQLLTSMIILPLRILILENLPPDLHTTVKQLLKQTYITVSLLFGLLSIKNVFGIIFQRATVDDKCFQQIHLEKRQ